MAKVSALKTSFLVPRWKRRPVHPSWALQAHAAPTLPPSCQEPSVQSVSRRLHSLAAMRAAALSSVIRPGKRRAVPHSWVSAAPSRPTATAARRRAVSAVCVCV